MTNYNNSGKVFSNIIDSDFFKAASKDIFNSSFNDLVGNKVIKTSPSINIVEEDDKYQIHLAAPGMSKSDFDLSVKDLKLTIKSNKLETGDEKAEDKPFVIKQEYKFSNFERSITLSDDIDLSNINASYVDGILLIELVKKEITKKDDVVSININ